VTDEALRRDAETRWRGRAI